MSPDDFLRGEFRTQMDVPNVSINVVFKVIKSLVNKKSSIYDFSPIIIKENMHLIAHPLSKLFNQSIHSGKFPQILKLARITPLYKKGPKHDVNNYRPISQLNIFSKIFEKIMKIYLVEFLNTNEIINKAQFGFQKGKSTQHALMRFSKMLYENLRVGKSILSIFVDFSKAFDTVPHHILLRKLNHYGIRGNILNWFEDYLTNRKQITIIDHSQSRTLDVTTGVPQGSVLGPILFLIFINDLPELSKSIFYSLFADDSCLSLVDHDIAVLLECANKELELFYQWCIANRLSMNTLKTFYILFTNKSISVLPPLVIRNNYSYDVIQRVNHLKFLGVVFDEKLSFSKHIATLCNKLSRSSSLLYQLRDFLPTHILKNIYYAHIYPHLNYCNCIWSNTYRTHLTPLILTHKKIIRNISKAEFLQHTEPLYHNLKILNIENIRLLNLGLIMYKQVNDNVFNIPILPRNHNHFTRHRNLLLVPQHSLTLYSNSFIVQAVKFWNQIPENIRNAPTIATFKRKIIRYLLSNSIQL